MRGRSEATDSRVLLALWSAIDLYRLLALGYVVYLFVARIEQVAHPLRGAAVLTVLGIWTLLTLAVRRRGMRWLGAELALAAGAVLASRLVDSTEVIVAGAPTVPGMWPAATVLSWAVAKGPGAGMAAAAVIAVADVVVIGIPSAVTVHNIVILLLLGGCVGYCADLVREGQAALREAAQTQARIAERERLAREVHDGVLQTLSYVHRRGLEAGGEAARIGRLAAKQEAALRELIRTNGSGTSTSAGPTMRTGLGTGSVTGLAARQVRRDVAGAVTTDGPRDLVALLRARSGPRVTIIDPGTPVIVDAHVASEMDAAVGAALDNVECHAGDRAKAWVLVEHLGDHVVVTVRDDGVGIPAGRLDEAAQQGRLGVACSIVGRMGDLGGSARVIGGGQGTRIELEVPVERNHDR